MAISFSPPALFPPPFSPPRTLYPYANPIVSTNSLHHGLRIAFRTQRTLRSGLCISCLRYSRAAVVTGKSWDKLILESSSPTLVEFYASWCGPCRMVHRVIDEIAAEYSGKLKCFVIYADKDRKVAQNYDVKSVPVVLLFKNGEVVESVTGTMPKEFYVAAIERVLAS